MPQGPLEPLQLVPALLAQLTVMVHQAFGILVEDGKAHRDVWPVERMLGLWAHVELKLAHRVAAIGKKRNLLVQLHPLRFQDLEQSPFRFGIKRLHEAKALARERIPQIASKENCDKT